jgi:predicted enzyme related to lactoylglutathione lyase
MKIGIGYVTLDCVDIDLVTNFYEALLDLEGRDGRDGYVWFSPHGEGAMPLAFQRVPEGKVAKNRLHLDLQTDNLPEAVAKAVGLGATVEAEHEWPGYAWQVLQDPEGNEFCIAAGAAVPPETD